MTTETAHAPLSAAEKAESTRSAIRPNYRELGKKYPVSYAEAADFAGVSVRTIYDWISRGKTPSGKRRERLPVAYRRGTYRIMLWDLEKYLRKE